LSELPALGFRLQTVLDSIETILTNEASV